MMFPHRYYLKIKERATWKRAFVLYLGWRPYYRDMFIGRVMRGGGRVEETIPPWPTCCNKPMSYLPDTKQFTCAKGKHHETR